MNAEELALVASILLSACPMPNVSTSLVLPLVAPTPSHLPDETPEPAHPPHGEGSRGLATFTGLNASGAMSNAHAQATFRLWEPRSVDHSAFNKVFAKPVPRIMLKIAAKAAASLVAPRPPIVLVVRERVSGEYHF